MLHIVVLGCRRLPGRCRDSLHPSEQSFRLERADYASRLLIERRSLKDEDVTNESRAEPGVRSHCRFISIGDACTPEDMERERLEVHTRDFMHACEKDAHLLQRSEEFALALPLTWGASLLDVDQLGVTALRMLIAAARMGDEDCHDVAALCEMLRDAVQGQKLPGTELRGCGHSDHDLLRALRGLLLLFLSQGLQPNAEKPVPAQAAEYAETISSMREHALLNLLKPKAELLMLFARTRLTMLLALPLRYGEFSKDCIIGTERAQTRESRQRHLSLLTFGWVNLDRLSEEMDVQQMVLNFEQMEPNFRITFVTLVEAIRNAIAPPNPETDQGFFLRSLSLDGTFDLARLRQRAREAVERLSSRDAAPLPARAPCDQGLAALLCVEGIATSLLQWVPAGTQHFFCHHTTISDATLTFVRQVVYSASA